MDFFGLELEGRAKGVLLEMERDVGEGRRFWNVPRSSGVVLAAIASVLGAGRVLEIGTSSGYSGIFLAEAIRGGGRDCVGGRGEDGGRLYTIESHAERFAVGGENFARAGVDGFVERIKGHAPEVIYERFYEGDEVDGGGGAGKRVNPE
ncbi:class I SAM-dependent methyltransferase, partial [Patescibacteria group bacterium]|nr:class I SAM-dependent methyltransferase [Patescibacteria group bacterium]